MSSLKTAIPILADETTTSCAKTKSAVEAAKPFLVPNGSKRPSDSVTGSVEAIVDFLLAQGSMPA